MARGILSQNSSAGLLSMLPANVGATPEALRRRREEEARLAAMQRPQPERRGVNPLRVALRTIFSGEDPFTALDSERERLAAEPMREASRARMARLQSYVDTLSPDLQLAFESSPDKLGEALASRAEAVTLDPGDVRLSGERVIYGAPFDAAPGSSIFDPTRPGQPIARAPSEAKVAGGALVAPDGTVLYRGPQVEGVAATADAFYTPEIAQGQGGGAPRIVRASRPDTVTVADGAEVYDPVTGRMVARNTPDPRPQDAEAAAARQRAAEAERQQIAQVRDSIGRARQQIGFWTTGPLAGLSAIGGTPAADLAATLDTIEANLSFRALAEMRANSPTGGALGSITERELQLLGSTVANLRQSQSPTQLRENLSIIERTLGEIERRGQQGQQSGPSREALLAEARRRGLIR